MLDKNEKIRFRCVIMAWLITVLFYVYNFNTQQN